MKRFAIAAACVLLTTVVSAEQVRRLRFLVASPGGSVTVTITTPTSSATYDAGFATTVDLAGTATGSPSSCTGNSDVNGSFTVTGTSSWSAADVPLDEGDNVLTVTCDGEDDVITVSRSMASGDHNDNFNTLTARGDHFWSHAMRDSSWVTSFGEYSATQTTVANATYDAGEDAMVWTWVNGSEMGNGERFLFGMLDGTKEGPRLEHPAAGTQKILIQVDWMMSSSWLTGHHVDGWKWMNLLDNTIWLEPQLRGLDGTWHGDMPPAVGATSARMYNDPVPPTTDTGTGWTHCGVGMGSNAIGPMVTGTCSKVYPDQWFRYWIEMTHVAGETYMGSEYAHLSVWFATETSGPTKILDDVMQTCAVPWHQEFWFELNASIFGTPGADLKMWARNLVVLKDYAVDPETLMERPLATQ